MQKTFFIFLSVAIVLPLATAYNCTELEGENEKVCNYVENTDWPQAEKDSVIGDLISNEGSLNGNFESIITKPIKEDVKLNKLEEVDLKISEENKKFLIDFSSISIFGYFVYAFLRKYYLLLRLL
jgi:hypothetical protein